MKKKRFIPLLFITACSFAQTPEATRAIQSGNEYYKKQQFGKAEEEYAKALDKDPADMVAKFNQANAIYKQDQKVEAAKMYNTITKESQQRDMRSKAFYNKGVILSSQKNLEESIEAYKNTLRLDPTDKEARENLQKALLELKKKPPPPKKEDKQQKKKKEQEPQKKQSQPKMSPKEAEQRLQLLQQKEKEVQQRLQKEKNKMGGSQPKDW